MDVYNDSNPIIFGIPHDDIQSCDVTTVLTGLNSFLDSENALFWLSRISNMSRHFHERLLRRNQLHRSMSPVRDKN